MKRTTEWQSLRRQLRKKEFNYRVFENQYFRRLTRLLEEGVGPADLLLAYRDALMAAEDPASAELVAHFEAPLDELSSQSFGLRMKRNGSVQLTEPCSVESIDLRPIYLLEQRRHIHEEPIDPALQTRLGDSRYSHYRGKAQQLAVRIALTSEPNSTLIVNLPTGCGKTLVAQSASLFSANNSLTVVIVPTIGLAIEQGHRTKKFLARAGEGHSGLYCWHGGQSKADHDEIKKRIRLQQQRVLYCSPEAACRSLLPTLFQAAANRSLSHIVIDEAHIVDQWGAEFRPYFQVLASLTRSLQNVAPDGLRLLLMSATFSNKSMKLVEELFASDNTKVVHVNGCFLRPEIQFSVRKVEESEHLKQVIDAVIALPKPMIVYVLYPHHADAITRALRGLGLNRVRKFTGNTPPQRREELVEGWAESNFDIVVATSAFGLGMDKADVRSVIHAAVPENLDRFYQEVGRGGRDGRASQSLVVYHDRQIDDAWKLNNDRLITVELGLRKWTAMWNHGQVLDSGGRKVAVSTLRPDQRIKSDRNEEWNWRTLLLMQRAGLIRIALEQPSPPEIDQKLAGQQYRDLLSAYYDNYYKSVTVIPSVDSVSDESTWDRYTSNRREFEKLENRTSLERLLKWLRSPSDVSLCRLLLDYYTVERVQPEYACGGCPSCRSTNTQIDTPTVGYSVAADGLTYTKTWPDPFSKSPAHQYVYFPRGRQSRKRLIREWAGWIRRLIENGVVGAICAEEDVLQTLTKALRTNRFWIGDVLSADFDEENMCWPQLILHLDDKKCVPRLGFTLSVAMVLAPEEVSDSENPNRKWWQSTPNAVSLDNYLLSLGV